jgi:dTDP-4-dehydrorhamnose 3,5-epimerase
MNIEYTDLEGVKLIRPTIYEDFRGTNFESYNASNYYKIPNQFVVDSISTSRQHVLRGIHGDSKTTKLISCLYGTIYFQWQSFTLSDQNKHQVLVPPGFGNAHLVMSDHCVFSYKLDQYYDRESQFTLKWNDDRFNIYWPIKNPILSERDR